MVVLVRELWAYSTQGAQNGGVISRYTLQHSFQLLIGLLYLAVGMGTMLELLHGGGSGMFSGSSLIYPLSMTYPSKVTVVTVENR